MLRPLGLWLALLGCLAAPASAFALDDDEDDTSGLGANTSGGLSVTLTVNTEPYNARYPLGKRACDGNYVLDFEVTGFATGFGSQRYVEVWRGSSCSNGDNRNEANSDDPCVLVTTEDREENNTVQNIEVNMADLCEEDGNVTLYFLPVDAMNTNDTVTPYGAYELEIDIKPPSAPTNVDSKAGETEIPIEWEPGDSNIIQNWLVWDTAPIDGGDGTDADGGTDGSTEACGSGLLIAGEEFDIDSLPQGVRRKKVADVSSYDLDGATLGARRVALGIISEDEAGNRSMLSNITCVTVVPTDGFWDAYQDEGGDIEQGCACSLPGTSHRKSPLLLVPAALALVALRFRRKRRS